MKSEFIKYLNDDELINLFFDKNKEYGTNNNIFKTQIEMGKLTLNYFDNDFKKSILANLEILINKHKVSLKLNLFNLSDEQITEKELDIKLYKKIYDFINLNYDKVLKYSGAKID